MVVCRTSISSLQEFQGSRCEPLSDAEEHEIWNLDVSVLRDTKGADVHKDWHLWIANKIRVVNETDSELELVIESLPADAARHFAADLESVKLSAGFKGIEIGAEVRRRLEEHQLQLRTQLSIVEPKTTTCIALQDDCTMGLISFTLNWADYSVLVPARNKLIITSS